MKVNLSALGDGIIVLGLGTFIITLASVYYPSSQQNVSIAGLFVLGATILVAGLLKIGHAFSSLREEKQSSPKTPVAATIMVLLVFYFLGLFVRR